MRRLLWIILSVAITTFFYFSTTQVAVVDVDHKKTLISNQDRDDLQRTFENAINQAKRSIVLKIYSLYDHKLIAALNAKSLEGVSIKIITDRKASGGLRRKLESAISIEKPNHHGLMHLKVLVIDEEIVWVGSANFTRASLKTHGNLVSGLYSPELAHFLLQNESQSTEVAIDGQKIEMWLLPKNPKALSRIKNLINTAEKTVRVAMYTFTRADLTENLIDAKNRGVSVSVVIDGNTSYGASKKVVKALKENGVHVRRSTGAGLLHHKFMIVDNKTLVSGSANWTKAAFTQNTDCFMIMNHLLDRQMQKLENVWSNLIYESEPA